MLAVLVAFACASPPRPAVTRVDVPDGRVAVIELPGAVVVWIAEAP